MRRLAYLFAMVAGVAVLIGLALLALDFRRRFRIPRAFVPVTAYSVDRSVEANFFNVSVRRVSHHPGQQVSTSSRFRSDVRTIPEYIEIDGLIELDDLAPQPIGMLGDVAFVDGAPARSQVLTEGNDCVSEGWPTQATTIPPDKSVRFTIRVFVGSNDAARRIRNSILKGTLPSFRLGYFKALSQPCGPLPNGEDISVQMESTAMFGEEHRDFFPFGEPLAGEMGPNRRLYWRPWLLFAPLPESSSAK